MSQITFDPQTLGSEVGQFKAACVRAENASTPFARKALAGLLTGGASETSLTLLMLAAFKPKRPNGKPADKLSQLRYAVGGDAARKATQTIFDIFANVDLSPDIRAAVVDFVLERPGSAKSLNALSASVKALVKAHNTENGADEAADNADDTSPEENGEAAPEPVQSDLETLINQTILALGEASPEAIEAATPRIEELVKAVTAAWDRSTSEEMAQAA